MKETLRGRGALGRTVYIHCEVHTLWTLKRQKPRIGDLITKPRDGYSDKRCRVVCSGNPGGKTTKRGEVLFLVG